MEEKLFIMEHRLDEIERKVDSIHNRLEQMYERFIGSKLYPEGLVDQIKDLQIEVANLKKFKLRVIYTVSAIIGIGGIIGYLANVLYTYLNRK